jgi:acetoin:2,6-dichlorophenolindophenol oxidoreductase subunit beta
MDNRAITYKDAIRIEMEKLGNIPNTIFLGYNVKNGKAGGMLSNIPESKLFETPVAENLMTGIAIGLSIEGYLPILYFERFNFILNALDAVVNHLDKFENLSNGEYKPKIIIRTVIGSIKNPFLTGTTHTQDFTESIKKMVSFDVVKLSTNYDHIINTYKNAINSNKSTIIVEEKDLYNSILT